MSAFKTKLRAMALMLCLGLGVQPVMLSSANAAATPWVGDANAAARLITAVEATGSAGQIDAALQIRLAPGWHAYWRSPGDAGFPPSINWSGSQNVKSAQLFWPAPKRFILDGLITQGYENAVVFPIAAALDREAQPARLQASVHYAACKDICVPYTAKFTLPLPAGVALPGPEAPLIAAAWNTVPATPAEAGLSVSSVVISNVNSPSPGSVVSVVLGTGSKPFSHPDIFIEGLPGSTPGIPTISLDPENHRAILSVFLKNHPAAPIAGKSLQFTLEGGAQSVAFTATPVLGPLPGWASGEDSAGIILIALLGGLILNIMPCVLPVLSLKLFGLISATGTQRQQFRLNLLATAAGVMFSFLVIAVLLILLKTAGAAIGWGIQFQQPWFLGAMVVLTTLFAANLWDWLPIATPGFARQAAAIGASGHPRIVSFFTGAFATILATSCSAPFVGTAVGFALARDSITILEIFMALGLGMALPYLAIAAAPRLVSFLPKPGGWMIKLRIALGFALLGTAIWLITIIAAVVSFTAAIISSIILLSFMVILFVRYRTGLALPLRRRIWSGFAVVLAVAGIMMPGILHRTAVQSAYRDVASVSVFQPFDQSRINGLVAQNKLIFVDVTAAWCLVCKVNALTVLDRDPVAAQLRAANVVAMRADWTRPSQVITAYLESFHRYGVPLDVIYGPGAPSGMLLPSLLTPGAVIDAFRRAGAPVNPANQPEVSQ
jgi:suppressor for copper-sensitivity B